MSIRLYLLVDRKRAGLFHRLNKKQCELLNVFTQQILPHLESSMPDSYLPEHYPWCFVISASTLKARHAYAGAFMVLPGEQDEKKLAIVYGSVSYPWLKSNMHSEFPLTFWASRILNYVERKDVLAKEWRPLWQWVKKLRQVYSPWRELILNPAWHFKNHSQVLLKEGSREDYCIKSSDGVEVMPWKNWPECIQEKEGVWIWRQGRHKRILESQRFLIKRAVASVPDASC